MATPIPTSQWDPHAPDGGWEDHGEVVEITFLLPADRAEGLLAAAHRHGHTVGQLLRHLIDRALAGAD
jgi:hypothetical protein